MPAELFPAVSVLKRNLINLFKLLWKILLNLKTICAIHKLLFVKKNSPVSSFATKRSGKPLTHEIKY